MGGSIMATFDYELATDYNFPNINIYRRYKDGEFNGWQAETEDGYVMYDTTAKDTEYNPEIDTETPVRYYYTTSTLPKMYDISKFPYKAVRRNSVDEKYIF